MEYVDGRGWRYRVMQGLDGSWKARYRKPNKPWQKKRRKEEAEHDLAVYAERKGMRVKEETE